MDLASLRRQQAIGSRTKWKNTSSTENGEKALKPGMDKMCLDGARKERGGT